MRAKLNGLMLVVLMAWTVVAGAAELKMPGIFGDNMVLQRDKPVPVWGWADAGTEVTVEFIGQKKMVTAGTNGMWRVTLDPMKANSKPQVMTIRSIPPKQDDSAKDVKNAKKSPPAMPEEVAIKNVLIGDVWLCSGQSNMEMPVGYVSWTGGALNYEEEVRKSANPLIRQFRVEWDRRGYSPKYGDGTWLTAGPETTDKFSATGYFFARELQKKLKIPVAIINASQGATAIEYWISREAMMADPDFRKQVEEQTEDFKFGQTRRLLKWAEEHAAWEQKYGRNDPGGEAAIAWAAKDADTTGWQEIRLPGSYTKAGCKTGGIMWLRREIEIPAGLEKSCIVLPGINDVFKVYVNGVQTGDVSLTNGYGRRVFVFFLPAGITAGKNIIALRIRTFLGGGGINGKDDWLRLVKKWGDPNAESVALSGNWLCKPEKEFDPLPRDADRRPTQTPGPGINFYYTAFKFDAVIRPLIPYALNGVVWYQGEHNTGRTREYRKLIKMFVNDWRNQWKNPGLPFYLCQLPNNGKKSEMPEESGWAELREAQTCALELPGTFLANLIDNAEDGDLHPRNKQEVGHRLALLAMANTYGDKDVACYGPTFDSITIKDGKAVIKFKYADDGLVARKLPATYRTDLKKPDSEVKPLVLPSPGSEVQGFALCEAITLPGGGTSNQWVWADAKIVSASTVEVSSDKVAKPVAVRYAWANNPVCNLYNKAGLPAYLFRTDGKGVP
jgi:sialate O-acetylesterase